jgi:gas vesicle protein
LDNTLIGVIIGGMIGWIAPLLTLRYSERKWKFQAKVEFLQSERDRFERLYERNLERFNQGLVDDSYSSEMSAEISAFMPNEISDLYDAWMVDAEKTELKRKFVYLNMASAMKRDLAARAAKIQALYES